ncbi:type II toxin-antitoxin system VapC family toxin [Halorussus salinus]|uniref:type II toxin-antitoxin system VapC family toxin n=1 Tax=Halorussus salinus TaxID=1364935 RepID=UPI001092C12D|nr:PIN domain-containing protein [Halorussus salinus]
MKVFVDTNIFIAASVDEPGRGDLATEFLNQDYDYCTTVFNVMEFRTVLAKKKQVEQGRVEARLEDISKSVDIFVPDIGEIIDAYELQADLLLYPMDCLTLAMADGEDAPLVTFDAELLENGAKSPDEFL